MIVILVPFPTARRGRRKVYRIEEEEDGWAEKEGVEKENGRGGIANNGTKKCRKWGGEEDEPPAFFSIPLPLPRSEGTLQKQTEEEEGRRPMQQLGRMLNGRSIGGEENIICSSLLPHLHPHFSQRRPPLPKPKLLLQTKGLGL